MGLTYLHFLSFFLLVPLAALCVSAVLWHHSRSLSRSVRVGGIALLVAIALTYTIPWDNHLIAEGVWWYGDGRVAATIWLAPVEEYLFIALQSILVGVWTFLVAGPVVSGVDHSWLDRAGGIFAGLAVATGGGLLLAGPQSGYYLGATLAWAGPVLALQWGVGWRYLLRVRRRVAVGVAFPLVFLCTIDRLAIAAGIWTISADHTTGLTVAGLPIEESVFFLLTTTFVVQALVLLPWVIVEWD